MSRTIMDAARSVKISEITVIGSHAVGVSPDGGLWKWTGARWTRLETVGGAVHRARRIVRYSGHYDSARAGHA